jgi:hypothetical protein
MKFYKDGLAYIQAAASSKREKSADEAAIRSWLESVAFDVETARAYGEQRLAPRRLAFFATRR